PLRRINTAAVLEVVAGLKLATLDVPTVRVSRHLDLDPHQVDEHLLQQILLQFKVTAELRSHAAQLFHHPTITRHNIPFPRPSILQPTLQTSPSALARGLSTTEFSNSQHWLATAMPEK